MILYRTRKGTVVQDAGAHHLVPDVDWDTLINRDELASVLRQVIEAGDQVLDGPLDPADLLAPISRQEVWAAGVTYYRSRTARMEESEDAGGAGDRLVVPHGDETGRLPRSALPAV